MSINLPIPQITAPFMFWCQKVLPLVYDDSLSYYEVLCKLVTYVNGLRDDVIKLGEDVSELNKLYNELAKLLDDYFSAGVQDSVNKKLDEMASDGYFDNILSKYVTEYFSLNFDTTQQALDYHFSVGQTVHTNGYYSPGDGGACTFQVVTDAPFSGIKTSDGLYLMPTTVNKVITPEIYGARGDKLTDDSGALQKALDCCFKNPTSFTFKGTRFKNYGVATPIDIDMSNVPNSDGLIDFNGAKITAIANKMQYVLSYKTTGSVNGSYVHHAKTTLTNVVIECNNEKAHTGLYIPYSAGTLFSNINIFGCRRGILLAGGFESTITHCFVRRNADDDIVAKMDPDDDGVPDANWVDPLKDVFPEKNREETMVDGKIDLVKTQCVGFELRVSDSFLNDCISVDCIVGTRISQGDNKITGFHPWNAACVKQLKHSCCVLTTGNNYFSNLTCDRFYIGVYCLYNIPNFFNNTLFTNQPTKDFNGDFDTYCWFINPDYAIRSNGGTVYANNTSVKGNTNTTGLKLNLNWCNLTYNCIHDINTHGKNVLNYIPHIDSRNKPNGSTNNIAHIKADTFGKIRSTTGTIKLDDKCNNALFTPGTTNAGFRNNTVFVANSSMVCTFENDEAWLNFGAVKDASKSVYMYIGSEGDGKFSLISGHKYLISLKYKTTNNYGRIFIKGDNAIFPSTSLVADGAEHLWWNMFDYSDSFRWTVGVPDAQNLAVGNIAITNIRCYDITNIPRYFLENTGAYFKRITDFIGGSMQSVTVPVRNDISFVSTQMPLEFGRNTTVNQSAKNYDALSDFYTVRYTAEGRPMIWCRKNTIVNPPEPNLYFENWCPVQFNNAMFAYFSTSITDYKNNFSFYLVKNNGNVYFPLYILSGDPNDGSFAIDKFDGDNFIFKLRSKINTNGEPAILTSFRANYDDGCDAPVVDSGNVIPIFENGGIYPILKGSGENEDYMRELPTIAYTIDY
jgi:hypothetical protein